MVNKPTFNLSALISKYFARLKVKDFTELSEEERATYDEWQTILSAEATVENVSEFIKAQLHQLDEQLREAVRKGDDRQALFITARLENYNDIQAVIDRPEKAREALEAHINNLLTLPNHE